MIENKTIPYNVSEPKLILPEYGRNIQRMVDHCVSLESKEERTACACTIADTMAMLFPGIAAEGENRQKIWDHINIMSDFRLDIDFPCEVVSKDQMNPAVTRVGYHQTISKYRIYGKHLQDMVNTVASMEGGVEKDQLIFLIANQMKKLLVVNNPENASDSRVFSDIADMTEGAIQIDPSAYRLNDYIDPTPVKTKGKKKKK